MAAASFWKSLATIDGKARQLGEHEVLRGGWRALFESPARYEAVTVADLQAAAREILQARKRTVGVLVPPAAKTEAASAAADPAAQPAATVALAGVPR